MALTVGGVQVTSTRETRDEVVQQLLEKRASGIPLNTMEEALLDAHCEIQENQEHARQSVSHAVNQVAQEANQPQAEKPVKAGKKIVNLNDPALTNTLIGAIEGAHEMANGPFSKIVDKTTKKKKPMAMWKKATLGALAGTATAAGAYYALKRS